MRGLAYNPALDGLRALAVLAVLLFHAMVLEAGYLGVDVFLVLSGFLITGLMLAEREGSGVIRIPAFYVRRAYRLLPAFLAFVAIGAVLYLTLRTGEKRDEFVVSALTSLLYINNYFRVLHPEVGGAWFAHAWSLSLEEQFYLLWPLLLTALCGRPAARRNLLPVLLFATLLVLAWRLVLIAGGVADWRIYFALDTRADALLIGCALAVWRHSGFRTWFTPAAAESVPVSATLGRWLGFVGPFALALLVLLTFVAPPLNGKVNWLDRGGYTLVALLAALVVLSIDQGQSRGLARLLATRPLSLLGRVSYGLYLWHYPVVSLFNPMAARFGRPLTALAATGLSVAVAALSYRYIEMPIQRRRPSWAQSSVVLATPPSDPVPSVPAVVSQPALVAVEPETA